MAPTKSPRHALIERAVITLGKRNETSIVLWHKLAIVLSQIIGDAGFESMFFRNLDQLEAPFQWLVVVGDARPKAIDHLAACLSARAGVEAEAASTCLLIHFTDRLNQLIGELVTNRILRSAWGTLALDDAQEQII